MRRVRLSRSFVEALQQQLRYGATRYSFSIVEEKRSRVERAIFEILRTNPGLGKVDPELGLRLFRVSKTPFILLYEFDDVELRVYMLVHVRLDRSKFDLDDVDW